MASSTPLGDEDREKLLAYLDGELDATATHAWEARLNRDPRLRAEAEALRRTWEMLDYLPQPEASSTFSSRTIAKVSVLRPAVPLAQAGWRAWILGGGWAAVVLAAGVLGYAGVNYFASPWRAPTSITKVKPADLDEQLLSVLRVIENKRLYEHVNDMNFLRELADDPELFGDDK